MINAQNMTITPEMLAIISEIDEFKGTWKALGRMSPERLKSLKKIATIESVGSSNRIEGNKLTDKEVEELLSRINRKSFASRDEEEVAGYARLMDTIFDDYEVLPLNENYIKQFHKILLQYVKKDESHRGEYKKLSNSVMAYDANGKEVGVVFETAPPFDTPHEMAELVEWARVQLADRFYHPLIVIGMFIVVFLAIHPFQDGNGRLSRALTALLLLKSGYAYTPYSSIESIIEDNKEGYYRALRQTQVTLKKKPDFEPWLIFFLRTLQKQKVRLEYKVGGKVMTDDLALPKLSADIMAMFDTHERLTVPEIVRALSANINTVQKHVKALVESGLLTKHGSTRGAWYVRK